MSIHIDKTPGMVMDGEPVVEELTNCDGVSKYFKATRPIGSLFGMHVNGECSGIGRTREEAIQ